MKILALILKEVRISHWTKNAFIFVPLLFSKRIFEVDAVFTALLGFVAFCLSSSVIYIINDIIDREKDALHPRKKERPIASGALSISVAIITGILLLAGAVGTSIMIGHGAIVFIACYLGINLLYSYFLKHFILIDVFMISFGFLIRVLFGSAIIDVESSSWFLITTFFLTLFLGFGKRYVELKSLGTKQEFRKVLGFYDLDVLSNFMNSTMTLTIVTYTIYSLDGAVIHNLGSDAIVYTVPLVVFALFRCVYLIRKEGQVNDPAELLLHDPLILVSAALWAASIVFIIL